MQRIVHGVSVSEAVWWASTSGNESDIHVHVSHAIVVISF